MTASKSKYLNLEDAATYLGVSKVTMYRWVKQKKITYYRLGKFYRFSIEGLEEKIKNGK